MSRFLYPLWADLDDVEFAQVFVTAGVVASYGNEPVQGGRSFDQLVGRLRESWRGRDPYDSVGWRDPALLDRHAVGSLDGGRWLALWPELPVQGLLRLAMTVGRQAADPGWSARTLASAAPGVSPFIAMDLAETAAPWRFPLRIGFLDTPHDRRRRDQLVEGFVASSWRSTLIEPVTIGRERVTCDLLVFDSSLAEAAQAVEGLREVRAGAVLVSREPDAWDGGLVERIAGKTGAWAVGFAGADDLDRWLIPLMMSLSHDNTLDRALREVTEGRGLLAAVPRFATRERMAVRAATMARVLRRFEPSGPERYPSQEESLASGFDVIARSGEYESESGDASEQTRLEHLAAPMLDEVDARRRLQARITADGTVLARLRRATTHQVDVRIGVPAPEWLESSRPFPEDALPVGAEHRLVVVLTEPHLLREPLTAEVVLPASGDSTTATFTLTTKASTRSINARIIVLHRNRVLQTVRLPSEVDESGRRSPKYPDVARAETFVAPLTSSLDDRRTFDVAFVLNRSADGESRVTHVSEAGAGIVVLGGATLDRALNKIKERLGLIVKVPDAFGSLASPASVALLRYLAVHGEMLRRTLVHDSPRLKAVLEASRYLQVVSAEPDKYFPFELAYDFAPPTEREVRLCPEALEALESTDVDASCPGEHTASVVCPFGFWGLTRVIERHAYNEEQRVSSSYLIRGSASRDRNRIPLGGALFAASERVDKMLETGTGSVCDALDNVTGTRHQVNLWDDWVKAVADDQPSLLMLLPHTIYEQEQDLYGLEIAAAEQRLTANINTTFVPPERTPSIVALLGCETACPGEISYEDFPGVLRVAGAPIVIATLTEVLGRHAAPTAVGLIRELYAIPAQEPQGLGEVMVRLRRKLLREGLLPVLALVAFGDADWLISKGA